MKKLLFILLTTLSLNTKAQKIDTVKNSALVKPMVINSINRDTIYQIRVERVWGDVFDTTATTYVVFYDRKSKKVGETNVVLPYSFLFAWKEKSMVNDFVILSLGLQKK